MEHIEKGVLAVSIGPDSQEQKSNDQIRACVEADTQLVDRSEQS